MLSIEIINWLDSLDRSVTLAINNSSGGGLIDSLSIFFSGKIEMVPLYLIVAALLVWRLGWKRGLYAIALAALCFVCCDQACNVIKDAVARPRPCHDDYMISSGLRILVKKGGRFGFCSAHAANCFGFATCTYFSLRRDSSRKWRGYGATIYLWASLVGLSRIMVGKHYVGDVLVGALLGVAMGSALFLLGTYLYGRFSSRETLVPVIALFCLMLSSCGTSSNTLFDKEVKMMSYNVRNCKGMDDVVDYQRVADVIKKENPEVAAIQELDSLTQRYPGQDVLANLAGLTGMHPTYAASIDYKGGKYGIGILSKTAPLSYRRVALPCSSEPRSLLSAEFRDYYFCCTHLSLSEEYRIASVDIIFREISNLDKPVFIAGDLNSTPDSAVIMKLSERFRILPPEGELTCPADTPEMQIDYICQLNDGKQAAVVESDVLAYTIESDHRPVVVVLK